MCIVLIFALLRLSPARRNIQTSFFPGFVVCLVLRVGSRATSRVMQPQPAGTDPPPQRHWGRRWLESGVGRGTAGQPQRRTRGARLADKGRECSPVQSGSPSNKDYQKWRDGGVVWENNLISS